VAFLCIIYAYVVCLLSGILDLSSKFSAAVKKIYSKMLSGTATDVWLSVIIISYYLYLILRVVCGGVV
jgi:hypothetical protein